MTKRTTFVGIAILAVAVLLLALALRPGSHSLGSARESADEAKTDKDVVELSIDAQRNAGIETQSAEPRQLTLTAEVTGRVAPDEARVAHVVPLSSGIVQKVFVHLGDRVEKDQPLLQYDNVELSDLAGQYLAAAAELQKQKAQLEVTRRSLERSKPLLQAEAISPREFDVRQAEYEQAQAAVAAQEAEVMRIVQRLHRFGINSDDLRSGSSGKGAPTTLAVIRAPFSGVVTKFQVAPGEVISADKELFTVVDASSVWVLADLFEKDLGAVGRRGSCRVTVNSYPDEVFAGTITDVSDFIDPETRTAKLRCVVPNPTYRLKLEMFATVQIPSPKSTIALAIPSSAIQNLDNKAVAFVQIDGTHFDTREVEVGTKTPDWIEIKKGVKRGEKVVTHGAFRLKAALKKEELKEED